MFQDIDRYIPAVIEDEMTADADGPVSCPPTAENCHRFDYLNDRWGKVERMLETDIGDLSLQLPGPDAVQGRPIDPPEAVYFLWA